MIYEAKCKVCGRKQDYSRSIAERDKTPECCNKPMVRILSPTKGYVDVPAAK